jgi:putative membrane protein
MRHEVFASFAGFDEFLVYLAVSIAFLASFIALYIRVTPWREIELIRAGNMAAAYSLAGAVIGFAVPLASAVENSVNLVDMAIWAAIAMTVQIGAFIAVKLMVPNIARDIVEGKAAQGFFLGALSLAVGILNAACMSY